MPLSHRFKEQMEVTEESIDVNDSFFFKIQNLPDLADLPNQL